MSTFLQLSERTRLDCEVTGSISDVAVNNGMLSRIVNWVSDYYVELQQANIDWRWLRHGWTVNTVADDDTYEYGDCTDTTESAAITRFGRWLITDQYNPPKIYLQSAGVGTETWLTYISWPHFQILYRKGAQVASYPHFITIDPQNRLVLGPKPNDVYVVTGEYRRSAQVLTANDDVPEMPSDYHRLIVYGAMEKYAGHTGAQEKLFRAQNEVGSLRRALEQDQLPDIPIAGPIA